MNKKIYIFGLLFLIFIITSCNQSNTSNLNSSFDDSSYQYSISGNSDYLLSSIYNSNDDGVINFIIPQSFIINDMEYEMVIDYDTSSIVIDKLIGHIIYEKDLSTYLDENPNLIPVIENNFKCTNNRICIYTIKKANDSSEMKEYLAIKFRIVNVIKIEIFKEKAHSK